MTDIQNREDIELLVNSFYDEVRRDAVIGFIFDEIIGSDWSHHLPVMYRFWESILLHSASYQGQPVLRHILVDQRIPLVKAHFDQWLLLWNRTVDSLFAGDVAADAKKRASLMISLIQLKIRDARKPGYIQ